jgi:Mg2+/Co2+ transporter CorB
MIEDIVVEQTLTGMELWISGVSVLVLLIVGAIFSACETALTSFSRARMAMLEKEGVKAAATVNHLRDQKDQMLSALLLGNNLVNILASSLTTSVMLALFGDVGIAYATVIMTTLVLVFGEVLPKTYALQHADSLAMRLSGFVRVTVLVLAPVVKWVNRAGNLVLRLLGVQNKEQTLEERVEELRGAIELHQAPTEGVPEQRAMLRSILDLADVTVDEIMTHRRNMVLLDIDTPVKDFMQTVFTSSFSRFPVYEDEPENVIGTIHIKALLEAWSEMPTGAADTLDLRALLTEPWFVPNTTTLFDQLQAFRQKQEHFALVVDEYSALLGVVTLEDILEEIVGDIIDETDAAMPGVTRQPDGSLVVDGGVTIRDMNRDFDWNLPDDDYSTIAGLILYESKQLPSVGQMFTFFGFRFKVLKRTRNQITLVRVYPPEPDRDA